MVKEHSNLVWTTDDRDLLIEIKTQIVGIKDDIKDLKDGTSAKINDHETRIRFLEGRLNIYAGGLLMLQFAIGIALWYFK